MRLLAGPNKSSTISGTHFRSCPEYAIVGKPCQGAALKLVCRTQRKNVAGEFDCQAGSQDIRGCASRSHDLKKQVAEAESTINELFQKTCGPDAPWILRYCGERKPVSVDDATKKLKFLV